MAATFSYKGFVVTIDQKNKERGDIIIEGRVFPCVQVPGELSMWHCDQAWYAPDTLEALGRHFVDYWHIFTDPNRCPPEIVRGEHGGVHGHFAPDPDKLEEESVRSHLGGHAPETAGEGEPRPVRKRAPKKGGR